MLKQVLNFIECVCLAFVVVILWRPVSVIEFRDFCLNCIKRRILAKTTADNCLDFLVNVCE